MLLNLFQYINPINKLLKKNDNLKKMLSNDNSREPKEKADVNHLLHLLEKNAVINSKKRTSLKYISKKFKTIFSLSVYH